MSNKPPIEVPQGAIRLNTDSQKLEFFAQDRWYEFATDSPTLDGGSRGLFMGGSPNTAGRTISFITIPTAGNATDFGDLSFTASQMNNGMSNNSRGVFFVTGSPSAVNNLEFITIASAGNASDFGDAHQAQTRATSGSDSHGGIE